MFKPDLVSPGPDVTREEPAAWPRSVIYSLLKAMSGSMREAFSAGIAHAASAVVASSAATVNTVEGSVGDTS